ncbi:MAG: hypothetical protein JOZ10_09790 [Acidobacteria bacterium]|nr:hypothetical protein [Acidobacteriota bacterium]
MLQNVDSLYFRAAGEFAHTVDAVLVNANTAAVFNATPVEKWQSYRLAIERWREESQRHPDVTPLIYDLIDALLDLLRIDRYEDDEEAQRYFVDCYPEVAYYNSVEDARVFLARSTLPLSKRNQYLVELMETGSTYIPNLNLLAVHRLRMAAAARNVGRFVHHACRRFEAMDAAQQSGDDSLYGRALAEAMEQFCARLLYPSQPVVDDAHLISFYEDEESMRVHLAPAEHARVLDCALQHRDFELHARSYAVEPQRLREIAAWPGAMQDALATYLGQMLAGDLYRAYIEGELTRSEARAMMFRPLSKEARNLYFALARRVRRRPARSAA